MTSTSVLVVFWVVVAARLLVPLLIPRFPLFGILACLVLDAADQSIFQALGIPLGGYQAYDKALDIYYLSFAYLATMRNWENPVAFEVGRVLFYLRLTGVLAFELSGQRLLLLLFANVFEYFFIFYEIVRTRRDPLRLTRRMLLAAATILWVVVKLPQEWWIHVAQLDATDFVKINIFRAPADEPLWRAVINAPLTAALLAAVTAFLGLSVRRILRSRERERVEDQQAARGGSDPALQTSATSDPCSKRAEAMRSIGPAPAMAEKVVLITIVSVIFGQILPGVSASSFQIAICIALTIVVGSFLLRGAVGRLRGRMSTWWEFPIMAVLNFGIILVFELALPIVHAPYNVGTTSLFALLVTLFATLYDRYRFARDAVRVRAYTEAIETTSLGELQSETPAE
jgi:hypothetical protein